MGWLSLFTIAHTKNLHVHMRLMQHVAPTDKKVREQWMNSTIELIFLILCFSYSNKNLIQSLTASVILFSKSETLDLGLACFFTTSFSASSFKRCGFCLHSRYAAARSLLYSLPREIGNTRIIRVVRWQLLTISNSNLSLQKI